MINIVPNFELLGINSALQTQNNILQTISTVLSGISNDASSWCALVTSIIIGVASIIIAYLNIKNQTRNTTFQLEQQQKHFEEQLREQRNEWECSGFVKYENEILLNMYRVLSDNISNFLLLISLCAVTIQDSSMRKIWVTKDLFVSINQYIVEIDKFCEKHIAVFKKNKLEVYLHSLVGLDEIRRELKTQFIKDIERVDLKLINKNLIHILNAYNFHHITSHPVDRIKYTSVSEALKALYDIRFNLLVIKAFLDEKIMCKKDINIAKIESDIKKSFNISPSYQPGDLDIVREIDDEDFSLS